MNINLVHSICKNVRKQVANQYKEKISNPLFPLTASIIEIEIEDMRQSYYQKVYKKVYATTDVSNKQQEILDKIALYYIKTAITKGTAYGNSLRTGN